MSDWKREIEFVRIFLPSVTAWKHHPRGSVLYKETLAQHKCLRVGEIEIVETGSVDVWDHSDNSRHFLRDGEHVMIGTTVIRVLSCVPGVGAILEIMDLCGRPDVVRDNYTCE